jgi:tetratricopeptide (TPR) repeat protein
VENDVVTLRKLFDAALLLGDQKRAEEVLGLLSFRGVSDGTQDALRGLMYLRAGDADSAKAIFEKDPQRPENAFGLLLVSLLQHDNDQAHASLEVLLASRDPLVVHSAKVVQGAYDEYALFEEGRDSHLQTLLARALAQIGQCPVAEQMLVSVVSQEQDYRDAWIVLGYCELMMQKNDAALAAFQQAYALDPEKAEVQYFIGLTQERLGHAPEAYTFYRYALQNGFEQEKIVRQKLASLAIATGDYATAVVHYRAILALGNPDISVYQSLVTIFFDELHDKNSANDYTNEAYEKFGDTAGALHLVGWMAMENGDLNRAATFLHTAVQQDPTLGVAWLHKGMLEEKVGDSAQAIISYRKAYETSVGIDQATAQLAAESHNVLVQAGDL